MIRYITPGLLNVVAEAEALSGIPHAGIMGRLREILLQNAIRPFLPPSVSVRTGTIISLDGDRKHRTQDDLVLFSREAAPLLLDSEQAIMPIEGVVAQIEVKSTLTRADVRDAILAAVELRELANGEAPAGLLFAYDSDLKKGPEDERLIDVLREVGFNADSGQAASPIQMVSVATRGTWLLVEKDGKSGWWFAPPDEARHLLTFISVISNTLYKKQGAKYGVGAYLLDPSWLQSPTTTFPVVVPKIQALPQTTNFFVPQIH